MFIPSISQMQPSRSHRFSDQRSVHRQSQRTGPVDALAKERTLERSSLRASVAGISLPISDLNRVCLPLFVTSHVPLFLVTVEIPFCEFQKRLAAGEGAEPSSSSSKPDVLPVTPSRKNVTEFRGTGIRTQNLALIWR